MQIVWVCTNNLVNMIYVIYVLQMMDYTHSGSTVLMFVYIILNIFLKKGLYVLKENNSE